MSKEYQAKQAALTAEHIKKQDIVITTALIPGRPAPKLVSGEMVKSMKPGSVLVDLAVERGGNVEGAKPGEVVDLDGIKIVGYTNVAGRVAASASGLYARNLLSFIETMVDKTSKPLAINWDDELVKATALTRYGKVIHPKPLNGSAPSRGLKDSDRRKSLVDSIVSPDNHGRARKSAWPARPRDSSSVEMRTPPNMFSITSMYDFL